MARISKDGGMASPWEMEVVRRAPKKFTAGLVFEMAAVVLNSAGRGRGDVWATANIAPRVLHFTEDASRWLAHAWGHDLPKPQTAPKRYHQKYKFGD